MAKHIKYHYAIKDEILYLFDTLQDNSIKNIVKESGCTRTKTSEIINQYLNI